MHKVGPLAAIKFNSLFTILYFCIVIPSKYQLGLRWVSQYKKMKNNKGNFEKRTLASMSILMKHAFHFSKCPLPT